MASRRVGPAIALIACAQLAAGTARAQPPPGSVGEQPVDPYAGPRQAQEPPSEPAPSQEPEPEPPQAAPPEAAPQEPEPEPEIEPGPDPGPGPVDTDNVDDQVAQALYARGVELFRRGAVRDAKTLFIESLQRSPRGSVSSDSLRMLRSANRRLGIANLDDGRPGIAQEGVLDPYGGAAAPDETPLDPYGAPAPAAPPASAGGPADVPEPEPERGSWLGRRVVIAWSGLVGLVAGMAVAGPEDDSGDLADGAVIAGLVGAAGGVGLSYWLTRRRPLTAGQSAAIASAATWVGTQGGLLADATTGTDSDANDVWKYVAAGGLLGLGGGVLYARMAEPSEEDVALINSLAVYGTAAGVSIAAGMEVAESEAFSLNALFGSTAGIAAGLWLAPRVEVSLRRTLLLDLGAATGAAAGWAVLYPLISDGSNRDDEQIAGWVSTVTMGGGIAVAWLLTRGMDSPSGSLARRPLAAPPAPPALARREADGAWRLGVPFVRPLRTPVLAPSSGETALAVDLVSGRF